MKFLMFSASLRKESVNKKLIDLAAHMITEQKQKADVVDYSLFTMPLYNADIQNNEGFPKAVIDFNDRLQQTDGLIIASPEYNFSLPGSLKNIIDWVSRLSPLPWRDKKILLMSASPALVGGNRGLWATRIPLEACGAFVYPDMFSLASAYGSFASDGKLNDAELQKRLETTIAGFVRYVGLLTA
jgi:NAD(P)H-dependent FMN reductase